MHILTLPSSDLFVPEKSPFLGAISSTVHPETPVVEWSNGVHSYVPFLPNGTGGNLLSVVSGVPSHTGIRIDRLLGSGLVDLGSVETNRVSVWPGREREISSYSSIHSIQSTRTVRA